MNEIVRSSMMHHSRVDCLRSNSVLPFCYFLSVLKMCANDRSLNQSRSLSLMFTLLCLLVGCRYVVALGTAFRSRLDFVYMLLLYLVRAAGRVMSEVRCLSSPHDAFVETFCAVRIGQWLSAVVNAGLTIA